MALGYLIEDGGGSTPTPSTQPMKVTFSVVDYGGSGTNMGGSSVDINGKGYTTAKVKLTTFSTVYSTANIIINGSQYAQVKDGNEHTYDVSNASSFGVNFVCNVDAQPNNYGYFELS